MRNTSLVALLAVVGMSISGSLLAQEVCFKDAKDNYAKWRDANGKLLGELAAKFEASKDPNKEMIDYQGMKIPITAALIIESEKFGRNADVKLANEIDGAKKCTGQVTIARGTYDLAREWMGLTTILPEKATRIDFAELQKGNFTGGKDSLINKGARDVGKVLDPTKWKF